MVFDVDRLKEALRVPARPLGSQVRSMEGWYALPLDVIDQRTIAARLVVAGQPLWWCEPHSSKWFGGVCETAFIEGHHNRDCRKVEGWWMPTGPSPTGPSPAKPTCSHGFNKPHSVGGTTNFHYDVATVCDEWVVERGLATDKLKVSPTGKDET